jgi:hypothetical protein
MVRSADRDPIVVADPSLDGGHRFLIGFRTVPAASDPTVPLPVVAAEEPAGNRGRRRLLRFFSAGKAGGAAVPALLVAASIVTVLIVVGIAQLLPKQAAGVIPLVAASGVSDSGESDGGADASATAPQAGSPGNGRASTRPGGPVGTTPRASRSASAAAGSTRTATPGTSRPSPAPTGTGRYPAWRANHQYTAGDRVSYAGRDYQCRQTHTSQIGWEPSNAQALWQALT